MRMMHTEILEIINKIEKEFPVNKINYKSIKLWPYIRTQLVFCLFTGNSPVEEKEHHLHNKGFRYKLSYLRNALAKCKTLQKQLISIDKDPYRITNPAFLYLAKTDDKRILIDSKLTNPFADSMSYYLGKKSKCAVLELSDDNNFDNLNEGVYSLNYVLSKARIRFEFNKFILKKHNDKQLILYKELIEFINSLGLEFNLTSADLIDKVEFIFSLQKEYENLFSRLKPKAVYFAVFYQDFLFAAMLACKKLKIKSVEVQHGQQGDKDPFTKKFNALPAEGYELLPENFWFWGKESFNRNKEFIGNNYHKLFVGGNSWMSLWLNTQYFKKLEDQVKQQHVFDNNKKINILVALQPIPDPAPKFLIDAIKQSGENTTWFIRMHPFQAKKPQEILQKFDGIKNIETDQANSLPLYLLLKHIDFVITFWSTVAYEALHFGIHPIIIHPNGKELMGNYIDKGIFSYKTDSEGILSVINQGKEKMSVKESEKFIETDESVILNCIDNIIEYKAK